MGKKAIDFVSRAVHAFNLFDLRGRAILGLFSLTIIGLSIWATLTMNDIPGGVLTAYGTAVGCFAFNRTFEAKPAATKGVKAEC
jgi:hypothetical protein